MHEGASSVVSTVRSVLGQAAFAALAILAFGTTPVRADVVAPVVKSPLSVVGTLDDTLLSVMKNATKLGYDGRYQALEPILKASYNFPLMTKIIVGSAWNDWTQNQRDAVTEAFSRFTIATYARRFDGYSGESFQVTGSHPLAAGTLVETQLVRTSDTPVSLNYLLRDSGDSSLIVDVFLTGTISELATRRSEFSAVLKRDGYDGLLAALQKASASPAKS